jgi:hypothetical protein
LHGPDKKENFLPFAETAALMRLPSCLLGLAVLLLGFPLTSSATIYKWTDEHGTTVYSNRAPAAEAKVTNVQVALEDERPAAAAAPQPANPSELQQRVRALEQQVQSLQGQGGAPYPAQVPPPVSYYPPPDYYPQQQPYYPPTDYSSMYEYGYPYGYGYPYYPYYSTIVVTGRRPFRQAHVHPVHGFVGQRPVAVPRGTVAAPRSTAGVRSMPVSSVMGGSGRR